MPSRTTLDVHQIVDLFRGPARDERSTLVSAHRGMRWDGVPENSRGAVLNAARFGLLCIEIDVRVTSDGHAVVFHDSGIGRSTNIAEFTGRQDVYNPFTGTGYCPRLEDLPWKGVVEHLKLKDENGQVTDEAILDLDGLLAFIRDERLNLVLFLDVKTRASIQSAYEVVKRHKNASGVPALEWCVWKLDVEFYDTVAKLEAEEWWQEALEISKPLYIPVLRPDVDNLAEVLGSAKAFTSRPYCVALEVGVRAPGAPLQDVVDWAAANNVSMGYFATLGDIHPDNGAPVLYDTGSIDIENCRKPDGELIYFDVLQPPATYESVDVGLLPHQKDSRWDLDGYKAMGFSWVIADLTSRSVGLFAAQAEYQQPLDTAWHNQRLTATLHHGI